MTPDEFREIRHALRLSTNHLARLLGVADGRTVRRWEADPSRPGAREIPGPVVKIMRLLSANKITPADLA